MLLFSQIYMALNILLAVMIAGYYMGKQKIAGVIFTLLFAACDAVILYVLLKK